VPTALYRRYRPETFADVIGQAHVTAPLMQALRTGRVNHAYLFSGPRGCGKTTSARILARCLNCEQGPTATPCGVCDSCVGLSRGGPGTVDVIEIDAASHGGVDDARDLREKAAFGPASSRYKVYIIDEAHMVTSAGFNALLKIVEEPPEHVVFVFATTAPEKVIGTIRSRTHHYPFRLVPPARLQEYLAHLCETEGVPAEKGVLPLVVRAGGGSVRDSLSVLDQLIAGSDQGGLTYAGAIALLGYTDAALLDDVIEAFAASDGAAVFRVVDKVVESGHEPRRFVEDLLERLRDLLVVSAVPDGAHTILRGLPEDQLERMRQQASRFGPAELTRAADVVNAGLTELTGATSPRLQLELICARVLLPGAEGEQGYAARLDRMERRLGAGAMSGDALGEPAAAAGGGSGQRESSATSGASAGGSASGQPVQDERSAAPETAAVQGAADARAAAQREPAPPVPLESAAVPETAPRGAGGVDVETIRRVWPDVVGRLAGMRRVTWMMVRDHATVASFDGRRLVLTLGNPGVLASFRSGAHGEFVQQALIDVLGVEAQVDVVGGDAPAQAHGRADAPTAALSVAPENSAGSSAHADGPHAPGSAAGPDRSTPETGPPEPPGWDDAPTEPEGWEAPVAASSAHGGAPATESRAAQSPVPPTDQQPDPPSSSRPTGPQREAPSAPQRVAPAMDQPSADDVDAEDSGLVGRAVVEQLLGGRVIDEADA
jgi:DNA polymerase-3 subunit gamma/tau